MKDHSRDGAHLMRLFAPMPIFPSWLNLLCSLTLALGLVSAIAILIDVARHPPQMSIMFVVWPVCALFGTLFVFWLYFRYGREVGEKCHRSKRKTEHASVPAMSQPYSVIVAKGTLHCGSGCALGDIAAEWLAFAMPAAAIAFGWHSLFDDKTYAVWVIDFIFAFGFGIVFQYFAIVPMRHLSPGQGIVAALKADTLSLVAWQIGMYCVMAYLQFDIFKNSFGGPAPVDSVEFWGAMQLAMIAGFITSYPMNWWLIRIGIKERM